MSLILKMAKPLIKKILKTEIAKEENKNLVIKIVNDNVDLPKLDEKEEAALYGQIYDAVQDSLEKIVERL